MSQRSSFWLLSGLAIVAVGATAYMVVQGGHALNLTHFAPAIILVAIVVAWPFALGWRPFSLASRDRTCARCGSEWNVRHEGAGCPACSENGLAGQ